MVASVSAYLLTILMRLSGWALRISLAYSRTRRRSMASWNATMKSTSMSLGFSRGISRGITRGISRVAGAALALGTDDEVGGFAGDVGAWGVRLGQAGVGLSSGTEVPRSCGKDEGAGGGTRCTVLGGWWRIMARATSLGLALGALGQPR